MMLIAGFGCSDITPIKKYPLAGFDLRREVNAGVHDPLSARVVLLQEGERSAAFCVLDLLGVPDHLVKSVQESLHTILTVEKKAIQVSAIHTHAAPQSVFTSFACFDAEYVEKINAAVCQAAEMALGDLHPVDAWYAHARVTGVGSYRDRSREESEYAMPCDTVVLKARQGDAPDVMISVYACHPTVLNETNLLISRDLVFGCEKRLQELMPGVRIMFLNGACADISTRYSRKAACYEDAERLGGLWGEAVFASLKSTRPMSPKLSTRMCMVRIPAAKFFTMEERTEILAYLEEKIEGCQDLQQKREYISCRSVLQRKSYGRGTGCKAELRAIGIGDLVLCSLPFEYASADAEALADGIGEQFGKRAVICCYSNGYEGYLPSGRPLDRDSGYEDMASSFRSDAKQIVAEAFERLVNNRKEITMNLDYLEKVRELLDHVEKNMVPVIEEVAKVCADTIENDGLLYFFGTGHSHIICEEPFYRAGGLANIAPLLKNSLMLHEGAAASSMYERLLGMGRTVIETSELKKGDVLFLVSNSGRNAACIDAAIAAKEIGAVAVAITSLNHSKRVESRHPSGKKLYELCDYVLDNGGVYGDACVHLDGMEEGAMISPTSTVIDATMVNLTMTATAEELLRRGVTPTVFTSANAEGGDERNAKIIEEFKKRVPIL